MGQIDGGRIKKAYNDFDKGVRGVFDSQYEVFRSVILDNQPSLLDVAEEDMGRLLHKLSDKFGGEFLWRKPQHLEPQQEDKKIEHIKYVLVGERPTNTTLTDSNMSRIETKINEIIDHINTH